MLGNWDITSLTRKRYKLVEEAKRYFLDIAVTSSTKRQGLSTMQLSNAWKSSISVLNSQCVHRLKRRWSKSPD